MIRLFVTFSALSLFFVGSLIAQAGDIDEAMQAKLDAQAQIIQGWAKDPVIVNAVKAYNTNLPPDLKNMSEERWAQHTVVDSFIRSFTRNEAAKFIRAKKTTVVCEAFLSGADGGKVAFLTKPTYWNHKGQPKHDVPMTGKTWQGRIQVDESTGIREIQIAVPVMDGDKPIGSLVVGLIVSKL